ncbi:MAG: hypothetical protein JSU69_10820 [Candidatus Zixiibacteriota bacterium]|nr:MAG: hypothetical protein JSU69_10820 [candidate division Zixibacteria bacterium]
MKRKLTTTLIIAIGLLITAAGAMAQTSQQLRSRFEMEFERTQQVINQARAVIAESRTEKGAALLKFAEELQKRAHEAGRLQMYRRGGELTLEAREKARAAITVSRQAEENENLVQRQLEKTDKLISRVQERIGQDAPRPLLTLFNAAKENQRRAWEFYRNRELRPALKLSRQAEKSVRRLIERVKAQAGEAGRLQNQIRQMEQTLERIRARVQECDNEEAARLMIRAEESFRECQNFLNNGQLQQAENKLQSARRLMRQVAEACADQDSLGNAIRRVNMEMEQASEAIMNSGDSQAIELMRTARKHLQAAERNCESADTERCAANIKAAQMSLRKAQRLAGI